MDTDLLRSVLATMPDVTCDDEYALRIEIHDKEYDLTPVLHGARDLDDALSLMRMHSFARTLKTNLDAHIQGGEEAGPFEGIVFIHRVLMDQSPRINAYRRALDGAIVESLCGLARHASLLSLWSPQELIPVSAPLEIRGNQFLYLAHDDHRHMVGILGGDLPTREAGATYLLGGLPKSLNEFPRDRMLYLLALEKVLREGTHYPYKEPRLDP